LVCLVTKETSTSKIIYFIGHQIKFANLLGFSQKKMEAYLFSLVLRQGIIKYYETPWINFFHKSTIVLSIETLTFIIFYYFYQSYAMFLYSVYCYFCLLHTVVTLYYWQKYLINNTPFQEGVSRIYSMFTVLILFIGFRSYIYQHIIIDMLVLIIEGLAVFNKRTVIGLSFKLLLTNLTYD
jgi:hypothetical protein